MYVLGVFNEKLYLGFNLFVGLDIRANSTTGIFAEPVLSLQNGIMDGTFLPVLAGALVFLIVIVLFDKKSSYRNKQKYFTIYLVISALLGFGTAYVLFKQMNFF